MRNEILNKIHASHQGIEKSILRAKTCVYWPGINEDIEKIVKGCFTCQKYQNEQKKETMIPHEIPSRSWKVIGSDLFHVAGETYLLVADYHSKFPFIRKMHNTCTSQEVIHALKSLFGEHGIPERIISDNGPQYDSYAFKQFAKDWGFDHVTSSPTYAQSNGFIERTIQTVKKTLKKAKDSNTDIDMALLCLRTTPINHNLPSPAQLLYKKTIRGNLPIRIRNTHPEKDNILEELHKRQQEQEKYYNRGAKDLPTLHNGQYVTVINPQSATWEKAVITGTNKEPRSYNVTTENGNTIRRNRRHIRTDSSTREERYIVPNTQHTARQHEDHAD